MSETRDSNRHGGGGSRLVVGWRSLAERFRTSLFGLPSLWLVASVVLWLAMRRVDDVLVPDSMPAVLATTVDSARALLGAVASGTIAAASVVFSLTLVAIQLSSNAYSSRVLRTFLRDRFQQNMMGIVLATFFYSLLVLRDVRGPLADGGEANVPSASVTLAVVLALAAILALLASISHTAQSVRVSHVSSSVRNDTRSVILDRFGPPRGGVDTGAVAGTIEGGNTPAPFDVQAPGLTPSPLTVATAGAASSLEPSPDAICHVVDAAAGGWVQQISVQALVDVAPPGSLLRLDVAVGTYVFVGAPLVTIWCSDGGGVKGSGVLSSEVGPTDRDQGADNLSTHDMHAVTVTARGAIRIGRERTMQQDVAFGLTMLEDIALRALSPGVNDPNTAGTIIPQLGELLLEVLVRDLPSVRLTINGITVFRRAAPSYLDYLEAAFGQIRRVSAAEPVIRLTMIRTLATIAAELERRNAAVPEVMDALRVSIRRLLPPNAAAGDSAPMNTAADDPAVSAANELLATLTWFSTAG